MSVRLSNVPSPAMRAQGHGLLLAPQPRLALSTPYTAPPAFMMVTVEGCLVKRLS